MFLGSAEGGGVQNGGLLSSGSMTITNCTISGNSVGGTGLVVGRGGGIANLWRSSNYEQYHRA